MVDEALTFFKQYMAENNIDLVTFFQEMDDDGSMAVSYDEFREGLRVSVQRLFIVQNKHLLKFTRLFSVISSNKCCLIMGGNNVLR